MKKAPWEKWEVDFLREVSATMPVEVIAENWKGLKKQLWRKQQGLALTLLADFVEDAGQEPKYHFSVSSPQKK